MPYKLRTGMRVTVNGKLGVIRECADKVKVKFDDGEVGFFEDTKITPYNDDSSLKCNSKYERMKAEGIIKSGDIHMEPTMEKQDPLSQKRKE